MKKILKGLFIFSVFFPTLLLTADISVKDIPIKSEVSFSVNVKKYGAKGDGKTDDTDAIRSAVKAAYEKRKLPNSQYGYGYMVSFTEVYFPSGRYLISDTIDISYVKIRGENYAIIEQQDITKDIFYSDQGWRLMIEGMTFHSGKSHISLSNPNTDTGYVNICNCHFYGSNDAAIQMRPGSNSTFLKIENSVFRKCEQALITHTDWTVIRDTWISTSKYMESKAVIEQRGVLMTIDNLLGVPYAYGFDQRWIDNYGSLAIYNTRFGGEKGGFTPIVNFAKFEPQAGGNWITIDNSRISAESNYKRKTVVYCEEIPNKIEIRSSVLTGIPPIIVDKKIDLRRYFEGARPGMLSYAVINCIGERANELPALLSKPVLVPDRNKEQLSIRDTKQSLKRAVSEVLAKKWDEPEALEFQSRIAKREAGSFIEIDTKTHKFDLNDYMDATGEKTSEYLAVGQAGDDIVILKRQTRAWPHILIKNVKVDLDKYPYLSWRIKDADTGVPNSHAVRIIDKESERMTAITQTEHGVEYQAFDVREYLKLSGVRTLDIKFYFLGYNYIRPLPGKPYTYLYAMPGDYMVLDFIRFEAE